MGKRKHPCKVCKRDMGWDRPSGVCSEECLRDAQWGPVCPVCGACYGEHRLDCNVTDGFNDSREGPWDTIEEAQTFAQAEVGLPWQLVRGMSGRWFVMIRAE